MRLLKTLSFLRRQNPRPHLLHSTLRKPLLARPQCGFATAPPASKSPTRSHAGRNLSDGKKPLDVFFKEAVGLSPETDERGVESESEGARSELSARLKRLEEEVRVLESRGDGAKSDVAVPEREQRVPASLYDLYVDGKREKAKRPPADALVIKELSPDAEAFLAHLLEEGYFREANFLNKDGKWDASRFEDSYSRDFVKYAAEKFGKDHQEIAKWLSGSDLKKIALFGCPSTAKRSVFAAKRLRSFFSIQEDNVCRECVLRESCKFVNQNVWNSETNNLRLDTVMKVITLYALELVPSQLKITEELKVSVSRVLRDILKLSQTTSQI